MVGNPASICKRSFRVIRNFPSPSTFRAYFRRVSNSCSLIGILVFWSAFSFGWASNAAAASDTDTPQKHIRTVIPILGTTINEREEPVGIVADIQLEFLQRRDHNGLDVQFLTTPGKFSPYAQQSVIQALFLVVKAANLNPDSWTIHFQLPYPGVTLYGESLSAMAALNIVALAKNEPVDEETVLTGTVTPDGHVGTVGGVPLKILAAHKQHFRKVLIPEEFDIADGDWETPFLMEVRPVGSISKAYLALTNHPLRTSLVRHAMAANLTP